jgi:hypothetical protein
METNRDGNLNLEHPDFPSPRIGMTLERYRHLVRPSRLGQESGRA